MDIPKEQKTVKNHVISIFKIFLFVYAGYLLGLLSYPEHSSSVLGIQNPQTFTSRLASVIRLNPESNSVNPGLRINQDSNNTDSSLKLSPENQPIIMVTPTAEPLFVKNTPVPTETPKDNDGLIYKPSRNAQPTEPPKPTTNYATPTFAENFNRDNNKTKSSPTPTSPQYRANWDRNGSTPTPTPFPTLPDKQDENGLTPDNKSNDSRFQPTPVVKENKFSATQIGKIIDSSGIKLEKPQITADTQKQGINVNGVIKDKLFGLLPVQYPVEIVVNDTSGQIETVSVPWWRTLFGNPFAGKISKIVCGDGICSSTESFDNCKEDCTPVCGNGLCEYGEGTDTCPKDCGEMPTPESPSATPIDQ